VAAAFDGPPCTRISVRRNINIMELLFLEVEEETWEVWIVFTECSLLHLAMNFHEALQNRENSRSILQVLIYIV